MIIKWQFIHCVLFCRFSCKFPLLWQNYWMESVRYIVNITISSIISFGLDYQASSQSKCIGSFKWYMALSGPSCHNHDSNCCSMRSSRTRYTFKSTQWPEIDSFKFKCFEGEMCDDNKKNCAFVDWFAFHYIEITFSNIQNTCVTVKLNCSDGNDISNARLCDGRHVKMKFLNSNRIH